MRQFLLIAVLLTALVGPAWAWNDDAQRCAYPNISGIAGLNRIEERMAVCKRALASGRLTKQQRASILGKLGRDYLSKGEVRRAIEALNEGIELDSGNEVLLSARSEAYMKEGNFRRALADIAEAIRHMPDTAYYFYQRGNIYKTLEQYNKAVADYDRALELDPAFSAARTAKVHRTVRQGPPLVGNTSVQAEEGSPRPLTTPAAVAENVLLRPDAAATLPPTAAAEPTAPAVAFPHRRPDELAALPALRRVALAPILLT